MKSSKKKKKIPAIFIVLTVIAVLFLGWIAFGYFGSQVEQLQYTVIDFSKEYEIREIHEHLIAETEIEGTWDDGVNSAFSILADYIFGNNKPKEKIAMTAPVVETEAEKIAMTAPVISEESDNKPTTFSFVLPSKYTLETLPEPNNPKVKIRKVEPFKIAVLRFSGILNDTNFNTKKDELIKYLERDGISYSKIYTAGYNPPWTPPFMQRLEVWAELN